MSGFASFAPPPPRRPRTAGRFRFVAFPLLVVLSTVVALAGGASAQSPAPVRDAARAEARFDEGVRAFADGNFPEALLLFEESYELNPLPTVLYNIAMCQRAVYDYASSIRTFRRYLADAAGELTPEQRREIAALVEEMRGQTARIEVTTSVPGARVFIDGDEVGPALPAAPITVVPGRHVVEARLEGHEDARGEVRVRSGETVEVALVLPALREPSPQVVVVERSAPPPAVDTSAVEAPATDDDEEPGVLSSWWFWTIVGAVAVGGGVTAAVLLWPEGGPVPDWTVPVR